MSNAALENHCTRTAWSSPVGCCRRRHNIYRLSVHGWQKRQYFCQYFTSENILCLLLSLIYQAVCLLNKDLCELSVTLYSTRVMPKQVIFFMKKDGRHFCLCSGIYAYFS